MILWKLCCILNFVLLTHLRCGPRTSPLTVVPSPAQVLQDNPAHITGKSYDIRLKENFKLFISGPSRCGKTFFVSDLLDNIEGFTKAPPQTIIYVYKVWQPKFDEMRSLVHVFLEDCESVLSKIRERARGQAIMVIFDDLINSKSLGDIATLFTVDGRHMNMSMVFLTQRLFVNNEYFRQISQNCDYFAIFKNPRNSSEIRTLAQQLTPGSLDLIDIYMEATKDPFSYLFINLTQECQPQVKYLSKLFDYDHSVRVFILDKSSKMKGATNCGEMSLVDSVFFNKADNKNYISVTNSYSAGKEILGAKANECLECDLPRPPSAFQSPPLLQSPNQSSSRPSAPPSDQPQPPSPPSIMSTNPPHPPSPPPQHPAPNQSQSTFLHSAPLYTAPTPPHPTTSHTTVPPLNLFYPVPNHLPTSFRPHQTSESEAHRWIDATQPMEWSQQVPSISDYPMDIARHQPLTPFSPPREVAHKQALTYISPPPGNYALTPFSQPPARGVAPNHTYIPPFATPPVREVTSQQQAPSPVVTYTAPLPAVPTYPNEYSSFICTLCNTSFHTKDALKRHNRNIHEAFQQKKKGTKHEYKFTCDICFTEFKTQNVLERHMINIHGDFSQIEKGIKRKDKNEDEYPQKYGKFS